MLCATAEPYALRMRTTAQITFDVFQHSACFSMQDAVRSTSSSRRKLQCVVFSRPQEAKQQEEEAAAVPPPPPPGQPCAPCASVDPSSPSQPPMIRVRFFWDTRGPRLVRMRQCVSFFNGDSLRRNAYFVKSAIVRPRKASASHQGASAFRHKDTMLHGRAWGIIARARERTRSLAARARGPRDNEWGIDEVQFQKRERASASARML
eukprot:565473-Pleurochrysis_carterae.AAC.5